MMIKYRKIAFCTGHYLKKPGAVNKHIGMTEFAINSLFVKYLSEAATKRFYTARVLSDYNLIDKVKTLNQASFDIVIDLHCNAFNGSASGHECLYWHKSYESRSLAQALCQAFTINDNRGEVKLNGGNGSFFCSKTKAVAVVWESAFIDNINDLELFVMNLKKAANQIIDGIGIFNLIMHKYTTLAWCKTLYPERVK